MESVYKTVRCLRVNKASCCRRTSMLQKARESDRYWAYFSAVGQEWFAKGNHMKAETNTLPASHLCLRFHPSIILSLPAMLSSSSSKNTLPLASHSSLLHQSHLSVYLSIYLSIYLCINLFLSELKGLTHFRGIPHYSHKLKRCWDTNIIITEREKESKQEKWAIYFNMSHTGFRYVFPLQQIGVYSTEEPKTRIAFVSHTSYPFNLCQGIFGAKNLQFSSLLPQSSCGLLTLVRILCIHCKRFAIGFVTKRGSL